MKADYAEIYTHLYTHHWWWRAREAILLKVLRGIGLSHSERILDIGCGEGLMFPVLKEFGTVEGIDPTINSEIAKQHGIYPQTFDSTFTPSAPYTLILMLDLLEHLDSPGPLISKAREILVPDGRLLVTVPAFQCLWTSHDVDNEHKRRYIKSEIVDLLKANEFVIEEAFYLFHWVFFAKLLTHFTQKFWGNSAIAKVPPDCINRMLTNLSTLEFSALHKMNLPFGGSVLALARPRP